MIRLLRLILIAAVMTLIAVVVGALTIRTALGEGGAISVGPGFVESGKVTITTTATLIRAPSGRTQISYTCQNPSTTKLAVGSSDIGDPTDAQSSPLYCTTNCPEATFGGDVHAEYARADSGTVDVFCRFIVAAVTPP